MIEKLAIASAGEAQRLRGRSLRRAFPIVMYTGKNGSGKSAAMIYDTLPDLDNGTKVLSTVRLLDYRNYRPCDDDNCLDLSHGKKGHMAAHPSWVRFTDWTQLMDWKNGPVLMDEITGVADSNATEALPAVVANKLAQLRRDDVSIRLTGLNFIRANKRIREAVVAVVKCKSMYAKTVQSDDGSDKVWQQRQYAVWDTYDAQTLPVDDHSDKAYAKAEHLNKARMWLPDSPALWAYDTYDAVDRVGWVSDSGRCITCDGTRRTPECSCEEYQAKKPVRASKGNNDARTARSETEDRSGSPSPRHSLLSDNIIDHFDHVHVGGSGLEF